MRPHITRVTEIECVVRSKNGGKVDAATWGSDTESVDTWIGIPLRPYVSKL